MRIFVVFIAVSVTIVYNNTALARQAAPGAAASGYPYLQVAQQISATLGAFTNAVGVTWSAVPSATNYCVYRADSPLTNLASAIAPHVTPTNYTDSSAVPGVVYYYWVRPESSDTTGTWCGAAPGYALLTANFTDKKTWTMRDTKKMDTLICKKLPGPWSTLLNASWSLAIVNARTGALVNGPYQLVTKNNKIWTLNNTQAVITYTEHYNKRKGTYKAKLTYKFLGDIPAKPGIFLKSPANR